MNKRHYEHTLPNIRGSLSNTYSEYLVDYYNNNSQETYDIIPITTCALSPETDRLFIMDDYPERFFKWADEFINIVY